ncbi:zf-HC2 domain-containing protein, partial [Streptomyces sp. NPDC003487]
MAGDLTCEQVRELSAELALGVLAGRERARAIAHLDRCADCREHVRQLTLVGDRLIGLLPDREPPVGFETRVARRLAHQVTAAQGPGPVRATGAARLRPSAPAVGPVRDGPPSSTPTRATTTTT